MVTGEYRGGQRGCERMNGRGRLGQRRRFSRDWRGQATVEMAVVFPAVLILVVISFNAMN